MTHLKYVVLYIYSNICCAVCMYSCLIRVYSQLLVTLSWQQLELKVDSEADGIAGKQSIQAKETRGFP